MKRPRGTDGDNARRISRHRGRTAVIEAIEPRLLLATFDVTNVNNSGAGSLRQAILDANAAAGTDLITFSISGTGVKTISPTSALPTITQPVTIDGRTQNGWSSSPLIQLNGTSAGATSDGLRITGGGCFIFALAINRFGDDGIDIDTNGGNFIRECYIGTSTTGNSDLGNGGHGVEISTSDNYVGWGIFDVPVGNVISGNAGNGVAIVGSSGNFVVANRIGTNAGATAALQNDGHGVSISNSTNNTIGSGGGGSNFIAGNNLYNVVISGANASGNLVRANFIGYGNGVPLGGLGVTIASAPNNVIGGTGSSDRNVISGNEAAGIFVEGATATGNAIQGNYIGTNHLGTAAAGNQIGIWMRSAGNTIGGTASGARNIISGNGTGILLELSTATGNLVQGNYIGTNWSGASAIPNTAFGVYIDAGASGNTIGGTVAAARNVISGNSDIGVRIDDNTAGNTVQGNYIGTNPAGTAALANGVGVLLYRSQNNLIGGTAAGARNIISGNGGGVYIDGGTSAPAGNNLVQGNYIGTNPAGTAALPNGVDGVQLRNTNNNTIGGTTAAARNVISGNDDAGVHIIAVGAGESSYSNRIQGNYIGTDVTGTIAIGNNPGVWIDINAENNLIGGDGAGAGNLISGNAGNGIRLTSGFTDVQGNFIGTSALGIGALPNLGRGIQIESGQNLIGGTTPAARNVISANMGSGIEILGANAGGCFIYNNYIGTDVTGTIDLGNALNGVLLEAGGNVVGSPGAGNLISGNGASGVVIFNSPANVIRGNLIGTRADGIAPLGNSQWGVAVNGGSQNHIGAPDDIGPGYGNTIAHNGLDGVVVLGTTTSTILGNSIFSNGGLGIDLKDDGVSGNDPGDPDVTANNMQNYPVLTAAQTWATGTSVAGMLNSNPNTVFRIEFFSNSTPDFSGHGEGRTYLGSTQVTTDGAGNASFFALLPVAVSVGSAISATASAGALTQDGFTSEFSGNVPAIQDVTPPVVSDSEFIFDPALPLTPPHRLQYVFSENVAASLAPDDLLLENLTTAQTISPASFNVAYDPSTNSATFSFPGLPDGVLPDGEYRATLLASAITDPAGNALASNHVSEFFVLAADADHDRDVDLDDFNILATHFNTTGKIFSQGNFNYDAAGLVNLDDFNILAGKFGTSLAAGASRARSSPFGTPRGAFDEFGSHEMEMLDELK